MELAILLLLGLMFFSWLIDAFKPKKETQPINIIIHNHNDNSKKQESAKVKEKEFDFHQRF